MSEFYTLPADIAYYSKRHKKTITARAGYVSDGATYAIDFCPKSWWIHDWGCGSYIRGPIVPPKSEWDDGTKITNWQLSMLFHDILIEEGYWWIAKSRFVATFLFGGGYARDNGMFTLKERPHD